MTAIFHMLATGEVWNPVDSSQVDMPPELREKEVQKSLHRAAKFLVAQGVVDIDVIKIPLAAQTVGVSRSVPFFVMITCKQRGVVQKTIVFCFVAYFLMMCSPSLKWRLIRANSSSVNLLGLFSTKSLTMILPTSCKCTNSDYLYVKSG